MRQQIKQLLAYVWVAVLGTGADFLTMYLIKFYFHEINIYFLACCGFVVGVSQNFFLNRILVFKVKDKWIERYLKFVVSCLLGLIIRNMLMYFLIVFGIYTDESYIILNFWGILAGFLANFTLSKKLVFRQNKMKDKNDS